MVNSEEYKVLSDLYEDWDIKTSFMSVGNTNNQEWDDLLNYCLGHKEETMHFYLDLIERHKQEVKDGTRADDYVGFFNDIIYHCFKDDEEFPKFKGFVGGDLVQSFYVKYVNWCMEGKSEKDFLSYLSKFLKIIKK